MALSLRKAFRDGKVGVVTVLECSHCHGLMSVNWNMPDYPEIMALPAGERWPAFKTYIKQHIKAGDVPYPDSSPPEDMTEQLGD